jgi:hypothetical protein
MKIKNQIFASLFATALVVGCANGDDYGTGDLKAGCIDATATAQVASIITASTSAIKEYTEDDIIEAYVTSSDEGGNFYKSISLVSLDNQKGFSIPVDQYNLYTQYAPGQKVYVKLKGLFYQSRTGSATRGLQIGANFENNVGRIPSISYKNSIVRACEDSVDEDAIVKHLSINQAKNDNYLNQLIEFDAVQFTEASIGNTYFSAAMNPVATWTATNHLIEDAAGNTIIVRISEFATFATKAVASGSGKIRGVLTKYNSDYQFMVRTEGDIQLTEDRLVDEPVNPEEPTAPTNLLFGGSDFENWTTFNASIVASFGLKPYAVHGVGTGTLGGNSLHLNGTPTANDYVFTISASAHGTIPANPTKITFWVKGTSAKSLSLNIYRPGSGYDVFNVGDLGTSPVTLFKAAINAQGNGTNSYTGSINTAGNWVKVTLDISDVQLNTATTGDLFALKVGSASAYNLHIDNIEIQ